MKQIPLTKGMTALVDDEDFEWLSKRKWHYAVARSNQPGYAAGDKSERMHRLIVGLKKGDKRIVDHIDGNTLNNCKSNLRITDVLGNNRNKFFTNNRTGYKGVKKSTHCDRWCAFISVKRERIYLGTFKSPEEAHEAYKAAAKEHFGEFANYGKCRESSAAQTGESK
ncbi:AP2 domain-containing protein [Trinickia sp.]|uniref:AP2 domain-containing protein n=1 Tax=Trinickia sp. TaxID=2571163 RepID=UPI003F7E86FB